ncbi:MAG: S8 family serine peptidase [Candidatus Cloacimonadaceae bacterium]|nr:S8 family serine peptidase [Candidatus Cloacimonadaceae bacterium]
MKTGIVIITFLLLLAPLIAGLSDQKIEPGKAVIKLKPDAKSLMQLGIGKIGIPSLSEKFQALNIREVKPRFQTDPGKSSPIDLSLILELSFDVKYDPIGICNSLLRDANVIYAEPIYIDEVFDAPNDANYASSLYFNALQAEAAWTIHKGENGIQPVILAVVDTGLMWKHPDIVQNIWHNLGEDANGNGWTIFHNGSAWVMDPGDLNGIDNDGNGKIDDLIGWDFVLDGTFAEGNDPFETGGHGTLVSGIANSRTNNSIGGASLAWNVKLMPVSCTYAGVPNSIYRGYDAIIYAAGKGAGVINCSWGGTGFSQANQDAVNYASSLGSVIVAAGGNSNNSVPIYPAAYQNVVAVAALLNNGIKVSTSSFGAFISVSAPTEAVGSISGGTGYTLVSNATSYASPIASSLAALIRSYNPAWTNAQVVNQLVATCDFIDNLNPGKENTLGQGKLNAWRALSETNPVPDQELKLALLQVRAPSDQNGNKAIEAGEQFSLNLLLRNYSYGASSGNVTYTLSSTDPMVTILQNTVSGSVSQDSFIQLNNAFLVVASPTATSKYVTFTLNISANLPIVFGASSNFQMLINAGGILVWEGVSGGRNMSGSYLRTSLLALGHQVTLGTLFPSSFYTFSAVFLSFGVAGSNIYRFASNENFDALREYLESGGRVYIEGGDMIGWDLLAYFPQVEPGLDGYQIMWPLLGLTSANDGTTNVISNLSGETGWHTLGIAFTGSAQTVNSFIDIYTPNQNGISAFVEDNYGVVAVQSIGVFGQRCFVFSYALRELIDAALPSTKAELVTRIRDFLLSANLVLPDVRNLRIFKTAGNMIRVQWDYPFAVDAFNVGSDENPAGSFLFIEHAGPLLELELALSARRFFKVRAARAFGL